MSAAEAAAAEKKVAEEEVDEEGNEPTEGEDGAEAAAEDAKDPLPSGDLFSIEVLPLIMENQRQHGLRHNDYQRYRQYCSRRVRRLRKVLSLTQGKHRFNKKVVTLEKCVTDARYLHITLMDAERAWGYAMHDKLRAQENPRGLFHMMGRLKKAVKHAAEFDKLVKESKRCDPRTQLEATAYSSWMSATYMLERRQWSDAMRNFTQVKVIYERLRNLGTSMRNLPEDDVRGMYAARIDEIDANIRYCAYSIQGAGGNVKEMLDLKSHLDSSSSAAMEMLAEKLEEVLALSRGKKDDAVEITWRGTTVPVKNEKLRAVLLRAKDKEYELAECKETDEGVMKLYDEVLSAYTEANSLLAEDIKATEKATATIQSQKNESILQQLTFLSAYVNSLRLERANERFLRMVVRSKKLLASAAPGRGKPDEIVRLYDLIIQNLSDFAELEFVRDDIESVKAAAAKILAFRAHRCFYVGEAYRHSGKHTEALALYQRTVEHAVAAKSQLASCSASALAGSAGAAGAMLAPTFAEELDALVKEVRANKCQLHAAALGGEKPAQDVKLVDKPLYNALDVYSVSSETALSKPNFVAFPPDFEPISCKPLFFDLASNHISFPSLKERTAQKNVLGSVLKSVTGWFGGSKA